MMTASRNTKQRKIIREYLKSVDSHPTAEMVHQEVMKKMPKITLATVYRNLNLLAKQDKILRLEINKEYRYDGYSGSHQHCVCRRCGKIIDKFKPEITKYALKKIGGRDFHAQSVIVYFKGICKDCMK